MKSSVHLSKDFFEYLVQNRSLYQNSDELEISNEKLNFQKILKIITQSHLNFDYTKEEIIDIIRKNEDPIKTKWLNQIIKTPFDKSYDEKIDYSIPNAVIFEGNVDCSLNTSKWNILCKGTNYDFKKSFFESPLRSTFDYRMYTEDSTNIFHECKNVILIDPYVFANGFKKQKSLVNLLDTCFSYKNDYARRHLTIISEFPFTDKDFVKNKILNQYLSSLSEDLKLPKENITLIRHVGSEFNGNRHLITDYALMDLQHIFDRNNGVISGLFLYNNKVDRNFAQANVLIDKIKRLNATTNVKYTEADNEKFKDINIKFGDILNNPLFD